MAWLGNAAVLYLAPELQDCFGTGRDAFRRVLEIQGEMVRAMPGRRTVRFEHGECSYYVKLHHGVGWREIFKNLFSLRLPVLGARNEWRAIRRLEALGVDTLELVGYGREGFSPARQRFFVIIRDLGSVVSLEDFCRPWGGRLPGRADVRMKRLLIRRVAEIAHTLHDHGMNHRDMYICHFLLQRTRGPSVRRAADLRLFLIDLHRVQLRRKTPFRWRVKDLAGLYFSSMAIGLTRRDLYRFMETYRGKSFRQCLRQDRKFWEAIGRRAQRLYRSAPVGAEHEVERA
jgi:heptose I phosphotransferase